MIKATDIAYVRFRAPDLDKMEAYLLNFGMVRSARSDTALYMRGAGSDYTVHITELGDESAFLGFAMQAQSREDLDAFAGENSLTVTKRIEPGAGLHCKIQDPDGYCIEIVHGIDNLAERPRRHDQAVNTSKETGRPNIPVRQAGGPSRVVRLGHIALNVTDYAASFSWYNEKLGLIKSDEVFIGEESAVLGGFTRCDCGDTPVDHHTIFFVGTGEPKFGHAAFEVENLDDLMIGHHVLVENKHTPVWGVGRHILGSQIFDYWADPWGNILEHWTDGDLYDNSIPSGLNSIEALIGNQWGEPAPPEMA
jgi:catechol 2,3-dioxygenase-like lactoylglutathione lyase family enzyme